MSALVYLELGFRHIADIAGYDHILFVTALAIGFAPAQWRQLALLVTAFTAGHSLSLALATAGAVSVPALLIETLIPVTIIAASVQAIMLAHRAPRQRERADRGGAQGVGAFRYVTTTVFGLVHGLGFSAYLRAILGGEASLWQPLLAFNIGLELGQLLILAVVLMVGALAVRTVFTTRDWVHLVGGATGGIAMVLLVERIVLALRG